MKIAFASSEIYPLIKTGGLADVSCSLPAALKALGQDIRLILPAYREVLNKLHNLSTVSELSIPVTRENVRLLVTQLPGTSLELYLVEAPEYFDRTGNPYCAPDGKDWQDNAHRFALFCRTIIEIAQNRAGLNWQPDILHCNDWQTGLAPALLALENPRPATIFTIHNLAYQGLFPEHRFHQLKLPHELWSLHALEFHHQLSFIKGGITMSDYLTTVSPSYAREVQTPVFGCGLEGLLQIRKERLSGILNGVDYQQWNPATDPLLPYHYDANQLDGKRLNKQALQRHFQLPEKDTTPLFAHVGRLVEQKGLDLLLSIIPRLMTQDLQLVILGTGDPALERILLETAATYPGKLAVEIGYDEALSHLLEAGADIFLMPSRFEPCGLNQLYSLRYGTPPVVHRTGGLADTIVHASDQNLKSGTATGFVFNRPDAEALYEAIQHALHLYGKPDAFRTLIYNAMAQDFSWQNSAHHYLALYQTAISTRP